MCAADGHAWTVAHAYKFHRRPAIAADAKALAIGEIDAKEYVQRLLTHICSPNSHMNASSSDASNADAGLIAGLTYYTRKKNKNLLELLSINRNYYILLLFLWIILLNGVNKKNIIEFVCSIYESI